MQIFYFKTFSVFERLYLSSPVNPQPSVYPNPSPFCILYCVQLPSRQIFHWTQICVCHEANCGYVTQCEWVPLLCSAVALWFPAPCSNTWKRKHTKGCSDYNDRTCHPLVSCSKMASLHSGNLRLIVSFRGLQCNWGLQSQNHKNYPPVDLFL